METLYRKVEIKSEQDLPKESGMYFYKEKGFNSISESPFNVDDDKEDWINYVDWYFQPVEPQEPKQTAEEMLKDNLSDYYWKLIENQTTIPDHEMTLKNWIIEAMEEYAGQCERESCKKCVLFTHINCQPKKSAGKEKPDGETHTDFYEIKRGTEKLLVCKHCGLSEFE